MARKDVRRGYYSVTIGSPSKWFYFLKASLLGKGQGKVTEKSGEGQISL